jgi:molybdenum cofactor synthesis domain-containing protein
VSVHIAVVTVSDGVARGTRTDASGDALTAWAEAEGHAVVERAVVADESAAIAALLTRLADGGTAELILTTGGTGLTSRDVTPEATRAVLEREAPGIAEALRAATGHPYAALSRGVAGVRGRALIVNLPGSTAGASEGAAVLAPLVAHAVQLLRGQVTERHEPPASAHRTRV